MVITGSYMEFSYRFLLWVFTKGFTISKMTNFNGF